MGCDRDHPGGVHAGPLSQPGCRPSNDFNWVPQPFAGPLDFKELYQFNSNMATDSLNATLYVLDPATEQFRMYNAISELGR